MSTLAGEARGRAETTLPDWMHRYDDVLTDTSEQAESEGWTMLF